MKSYNTEKPIDPARGGTTMRAMDREEYEEALRAETDYRIRDRYRGVKMVLLDHMSVAKTAECMDRSYNTVKDWILRYDMYGFEGLHDSPGRGRRPKIGGKNAKRPCKIINSMERVTPADVMNIIRKRFGISMHITNVRKYLRRMRKSPKRATKRHANRAVRRYVQRRQRRVRRWISRMKGRGFEVHVQDEAIFKEGAGSGAKFWEDVGKRVYVEYSGRQRRTVVFGAISDDGGRFFRTCEKFTGRMYAGFPGEMNAARGRVALIVDRASQHRSKLVKKFLRENRDVRLYYLPTARPEPNAIEQVWNTAKRVLLVSEYYEAFEDLRTAVSEYFGTAAIRLGIYRHLFRIVE